MAEELVIHENWWANVDGIVLDDFWEYRMFAQYTDEGVTLRIENGAGVSFMPLDATRMDALILFLQHVRSKMEG